MKRKTLVFDLDGTLVDSLGNLAQSLNRVLERRGHSGFSLEHYRSWVGWGMKNLVAKALDALPHSQLDLEECLADFLADYREDPHSCTRPYPGVEELLQSCSLDHHMVVYTNKEQSLAEQVLRAVLPGVSFQAILGNSPGRPHKPDPQVLLDYLVSQGLASQETTMVGDSEVDMETALRAGVQAWGVTWGYRTEELLRQSGAQEIFHRAEDLNRILSKTEG